LQVVSKVVHRTAGLWGWLALIALHAAPSLSAQSEAPRQSEAPGGFMDSATSVGLRPRLSAAEIRTFMPPRGVFTFLSPYRTQGVRLTNASDCGGTDCVRPVGYSYWSNTNNHAGSDTMLVFLGLERTRGGGGPTLFSYNKLTGDTRNLGPIFAADHPLSWSTGEGWYFSATHPTTLYVNQGPRLLRYDVESRVAVTVLDVSTRFGADTYVWQLHSSRDDRVHSATLRRAGTEESLGCVVYDEVTGRATFFAKRGTFDECQIDKSGRWVVIKENVDGREGEDNRIIDVQTGAEQVLRDPMGAGGHSDLGFGVMVAEDNFHHQPGVVRRWHLDKDMTGGQPARVRGQGEVVYRTTSWVNGGVGHIAFGNANPTVPVDEQMACASHAHRQDLSRANEIICFRLDGSLETLVVAPNMTDLTARGGGSDDYWKLPKGNVDVTGEYFIWTANAGTDRLDAYLVRIPHAAWSGAAPGAGPPPVPGPAPGLPSGTVPGVAVQWTGLVNVETTAEGVHKSGGCDGCPDAGAVSVQEIGHADGALAVRSPDVQSLRVVGLSSGVIGTDPWAIAYAWRIQSGVAEVREAGLFKADVRFEAGDELAIAVEGGVVTYAKNGTIVYVSDVPPQPPLRAVAIFFDRGGSLSATISGC
jgi:hypothetical protein